MYICENAYDFVLYIEVVSDLEKYTSIRVLFHFLFYFFATCF